MRNSDQPTIILEKNCRNSYYSPFNNEIVINDDEYRSFTLYHEYRHYLQCKNYPSICDALTESRELLKWIPIFYIFMYNTDIATNIIYMWLILGILVNITELDANWFAYKRMINKGKDIPYRYVIDAQSSYVFIYIILPIINLCLNSL